MENRSLDHNRTAVDPLTMYSKGVNYDVGIYPFGPDRPSRVPFDSATVRREMEIIRTQLHCTAVRIIGRDLDRLVTASEHALDLGLEVWFAPLLHDADEYATLEYLDACATDAERLRKQAPNVVFMAGSELSFSMKGLLSGDDSLARVRTAMLPWRLLASTIRHGSYHHRLNRFLGRARALVRERFAGPVTYAAGLWEEVVWDGFDFVCIDFYRDAANRSALAAKLRPYLAHGKPVIVSEFGCCTYAGAEDKGAFGWTIVDWKKNPPELKGAFVRDEHAQARTLRELYELFERENVDGAFVYSFSAPKYPHSADPRFDLDMASYAIVKSDAAANQAGATGLHWEPKEAFFTIAELFA